MRTFMAAFDDELEKVAAARPDFASSVSGFMNRSQGEQAKTGLKMPAAPTPMTTKSTVPGATTTPNRMTVG